MNKQPNWKLQPNAYPLWLEDLRTGDFVPVTGWYTELTDDYLGVDGVRVPKMHESWAFKVRRKPERPVGEFPAAFPVWICNQHGAEGDWYYDAGDLYCSRHGILRDKLREGITFIALPPPLAIGFDSAPAWVGVGNPPVGIECEANMPPRGERTEYTWRRVKVAHGGIPGAEREVLVFDVEDTMPAWVDEFRPIGSEAVQSGAGTTTANGSAPFEVGTECIVTPHSDIWGFDDTDPRRCKILAYLDEHVWLDVLTDSGAHSYFATTRTDKADFERMPEEQARPARCDAREKASLEIGDILISNRKPCSEYRQGALIYDAGYRKAPGYDELLVSVEALVKVCRADLGFVIDEVAAADAAIAKARGAQ